MGVKTGRTGRCENNKMICAAGDIYDEDPWRRSRVRSHAVSVLFEVTSKANYLDGVRTVKNSLRFHAHMFLLHRFTQIPFYTLTASKYVATYRCSKKLMCCQLNQSGAAQVCKQK